MCVCVQHVHVCEVCTSVVQVCEVCICLGVNSVCRVCGPSVCAMVCVYLQGVCVCGVYEFCVCMCGVFVCEFSVCLWGESSGIYRCKGCCLCIYRVCMCLNREMAEEPGLWGERSLS